jgi:gliding motility-associated-like protein
LKNPKYTWLFFLSILFVIKLQAQCSLGNPFLSHVYDCLSGQSVVEYTMTPPLGTAPYSFTLINSTNTFTAFATGAGTTGTLTSLPVGSYNVYVTDANGCMGIGQYQVNVPPLYANSSITVTSSCFGSNNGKAFVAPPLSFTPSYGYQWTPGGYNTQSVNSLSPNVVYSVTVTDGRGCTKTNTCMVQEDTEIKTKFTDTLITCFGTAKSTTLSSTGGTGSNYTYTLNGTAITANITTTLMAGIYPVITKDAKGCTSNFNLTMYQVPQNIITPSITPPTCPGKSDGSVSVTVSGNYPGYTYTWFPVASSASSLANIPSGSYTLTVKDATACLTKSVIVVSPASSMASAPTIQKENCSAADGAFTLNVSGGTPPYTYFTIPVNVSGATVSNLSTGSYTAIITDNKGCVDSVKFWLGNLSTVSLTAVATNTIKCFKNCTGQVLLNTTNAVAPVTYSAAGTPTTTSNIISNLCAGTYVIRATDAIGCPAFDTVVFVSPAPFSYSATAPPVTCIGKLVTVAATATGGSGAHDFIWNPGGIHSSTLTITAEETVVYSLNVYDGNGCTLAPYTVTVNVLPKISININSSNSGICPGTTAQITPTVSGGDGNYTYTWLPVNSNQPSIFIENIKIPTYSLVVKDGCGSPSAEKEINIKLFPVIQPTFITRGDSGCVPYCTKFFNITPKSKNPIWNYGDRPYEQMGDSTSYCYQNAGTYNLRLTVTDSNSCKASYTYSNAIEVLGKPGAAFVTNPAIITLSDAFNVEIKNTTGSSAVAYKWYLNSQLYSTQKEISFPFSDTGCYDFRLVAINKNNCVDSTDRSICVFEGFTFYMPSAFTPNADGRNDLLKPKGAGWLFTNYLFEVYNRWGVKVFTTRDIYQGWDGGLKIDPYATDTGRADLNDSYIWRVVVTDNLEKEHIFKGSVVLVR